MSLEQQIDKDLKSALLSRDSVQVETLRGLKSVILYAKVAAGTRDSEMSDEQVIQLLAKEAKKRQESIDLYNQGGAPERAAKEQAEKALIEIYLPAQLSEDEIKQHIDSVIKELGATDMSAMGQVIGAVKAKTEGAADGAVIARLVKERLGA
jgi:uncharacterized protein YqeY